MRATRLPKTGRSSSFPKARAARPGGEPNYKYGIVHLYRELKCPVLPIALNSGLFWPRHTFKRYPGTVVVDILPPIEPGLQNGDFIDALQTSLEEATDNLLLEAAQAKNPPPRACEIAVAINDRRRG